MDGWNTILPIGSNTLFSGASGKLLVSGRVTGNWEPILQVATLFFEGQVSNQCSKLNAFSES